MDLNRPTISTFEAGRLLSVSHDTVRNYWHRGLIEGYVSTSMKGGRLRLYRDSVEEFDRQRKSRPQLAN